MSKHTLFGIFLLVNSFLLYLLQLVSRLMARDLNIFSIESIFGSDWIRTIPGDLAQQVITTISTFSISSLLLASGVILFVMGAFQKDV